MRCPLYPVEQSACPISQHSLKQGWPAALWLPLPQLMTRVLRIIRGWHCRGCLGYPEEQVQPNLTSLVAWSRRAGQGDTAVLSEVRSSALTSYGMEPIPAEESKVLVWQGCLGGCALAQEHLEGLTAILVFLTVDLGTKTGFSKRNKAK